MTTSYPGAVDNFTNPTTADPMNSATVPHATQHANANDAIEAIETVLGTNPQGTSSTVKDRIVAAEGAILNLNLAIDERVPGETGSNAPGGALPNGYVWVNTTDNSIKVWNGTTWVDPSNAGGGTGLPWAVVSGGTVTEYTHPTHGVMQVHTFTGNGSLTVSTAGYAEILLVGGASGGNGTTLGNAGDVVRGIHALPAGSVPVGVGVGVGNGQYGGVTNLGTIATSIAASAFNSAHTVGAGGTAAAWTTGYTSTITGTSRVYSTAQAASAANPGDAPTNGTGANGVVIVAVKKP